MSIVMPDDWKGFRGLNLIALGYGNGFDGLDPAGMIQVVTVEE